MKILLFLLISFVLLPSPFLFSEEEVIQVKYQGEKNRDPFAPLIGQNVRIGNVDYLNSVDDARVEGILIDPDQGSVAIINGQVLKSGDFIGGFEVMAITENQVTLKRDGESYEIVYGNEEY